MSSSLVRHEPCPACDSRDNLGRFDDGHGYCFGCGHYEHGGGQPAAPRRERVMGLRETTPMPESKRGISLETFEKFGYAMGLHNGEPVHVAPYYRKGQLVAQHLRGKGKTFAWVGDAKNVELFGQHLWPTGGKMLVITEGELDALSMSQVQGNRWPVVSLPNGAQSAAKSITANLEFVESFERVILMFDMDEPGRAAAAACAEILSPGKARIAELPLKDANDMLVAGRTEELVRAMWNAKVYRPDGILSGEEVWELVSAKDGAPAIPYPWASLEEKTRGLRRGELVTFCAGTGIGKSTVCREIAADLVRRGESVGYIALEENVRRTALGFMSIFLNRPLHLGYDGDDPELRKAFDETVGTGRVFFYDHFGSLEADNLFAKMRAMVRGCGVQWLILDHVSIVVSGLEVANERKEIDITMTRLRSLAEELKVGVLIVSHLRRREGKAHEQGGKVSLADLRGSQAIAQLSDMVIALERDQQDPDAPNIANVRILKNRFTGETGLAGALEYDPKTGRLTECDPMFGDSDDDGRDQGSQHAGSEF